MGRPRALTAEQEDAVVDGYEAGATIGELASRFGCSVTPIGRVLRDHGITSRPAHIRPGQAVPRPRRRLFTEEQERDLLARYQAGAIVVELAAEEGVSRKAVNNALRRQGAQFRDPRQAMAHLNQRRRDRGERHPNFKGGRVKVAGGYVAVSITDEDPMFVMASDRGRLSNFGHGYVLEHRLVMARHLGRPLLPDETVHHRNGRHDDNRIENLELWLSRHPKGQRVEELREFAKEILALYPD